MPTIRTYTPADYETILRLMNELQSYVASLDQLGKMRKISDFDAKKYVDHLLGKIQRDNGVIFVAEEQEKVAVFIAGTIPEETEADLQDHYPIREGKIIELVVTAQYRGKGVGQMLMEKIEEYFRAQECKFSRVGCFASNVSAHAFYKKCGYEDRYIEMLKKL